MTLVEIAGKFPQEEDAIRYFEKARLGSKGIRCVYCHSKNVDNDINKKRFRCRDCVKSFSVTSHTRIHNTKLPLKTWMLAFSVISNVKKGISAMQLSRDLGIHYENAWNMYHKIRDFMSIENRGIAELENLVETDTKQVAENTRACTKLAKKLTDAEMQRGIPELDAEIRKYNKKGFKFKKGEYQKPCRTVKQGTGEAASEKKIMGAVQRDGNVIAHVIRTGTIVNKNIMNRLKFQHKAGGSILEMRFYGETEVGIGHRSLETVLNEFSERFKTILAEKVKEMLPEKIECYDKMYMIEFNITGQQIDTEFPLKN